MFYSVRRLCRDLRVAFRGLSTHSLSDGRQSDEERLLRVRAVVTLVMQVVLTITCCIAGLTLLSPDNPTGTQKLGSSLLGLVIGYWLR